MRSKEIDLKREEMITDEQKTGFDNLIELFDEIRRYVMKLNQEDISSDTREDLLSHLYRFEDDLVLFDSNDTLKRILDSIVGVVKPFTAREERGFSQ